MIWYKTNRERDVLLIARGDGDDFVAHAQSRIEPGETASGLDYEQWRALPDGPILVEVDEDGLRRVTPARPGRRP